MDSIYYYLILAATRTYYLWGLNQAKLACEQNEFGSIQPVLLLVILELEQKLCLKSIDQ